VSRARVVPRVRRLFGDLAEALEHHDLPVRLQPVQEGSEGGTHDATADQDDVDGFTHDVPV
jgi:hypothetical protein